ncbi:MAG: inositol monophosphatase [Saprospiraceae bacterium]|nr:inositol monophosphatase [Saprospiraceae bacterium]
MPIHQLENICLSVVSASREAGQFIREELGKVKADQIQEKEKHSLVSYVDIETEKMLAKSLDPLVPNAQYLTEENTQTQISTSQYCWIIDPLDGTTNFLKGIPVFSVSIALAYDSEPIVGVVYDVMRDECFSAWKYGGAYLNGQRMHVSKVESLEESIIATGFPYKRGYMPNLAAILTNVLHHARGIRRLGSAAIDLAYTAAGRFDGYYETRLNPWDIAAGILLIQEARGKVTNFQGDEKGILNAHHIVASNGFIHTELMDCIESAELGN